VTRDDRVQTVMPEVPWLNELTRARNSTRCWRLSELCRDAPEDARGKEREIAPKEWDRRNSASQKRYLSCEQAQ
jgi:hypothetical protein